jgi:transposase-like protein
MIRCSYCTEVSGIKKAGKVRGQQRFFCKYCQKYFSRTDKKDIYEECKSDRTTIRDIALDLGVSMSTVSRALRDHQDIHPERKQAILTRAKQLSYYSGHLARSLKQYGRLS